MSIKQRKLPSTQPNGNGKTAQQKIDAAVEGTLHEGILAPPQPPADQPLTLRQQKAAELQSLDQQAAQTRLDIQSGEDQMKELHKLITQRRSELHQIAALAQYIQQDLQRLPPDPEPPKQEE